MFGIQQIDGIMQLLAPEIQKEQEILDYIDENIDDFENRLRDFWKVFSGNLDPISNEEINSFLTISDQLKTRLNEEIADDNNLKRKYKPKVIDIGEIHGLGRKF